MENFEKILLFHFEKYPLMKPVDAVKLCYQSAFGCGHLVKNEEFALSMLKNELENTTRDFDAQLFEPIGGGYVRIDLHKAKAVKIPEEKICEVFIKSANSGEKTELEPKIEILKKLSKEGRTPFSEKELLEYLFGYSGEMISHSEKYKTEYHPAYRVILEKLAEELQ
ncbi:MAG: hypothetical protein IJZ58_02400 [Oscillospiraceae bacterium]|nr:hypothetical protein [Oscillospiraceae bacterium]